MAISSVRILSDLKTTESVGSLVYSTLSSPWIQTAAKISALAVGVILVVGLIFVVTYIIVEKYRNNSSMIKEKEIEELSAKEEGKTIGEGDDELDGRIDDRRTDGRRTEKIKILKGIFTKLTDERKEKIKSNLQSFEEYVCGFNNEASKLNRLFQDEEEKKVILREVFPDFYQLYRENQELKSHSSKKLPDFFSKNVKDFFDIIYRKLFSEENPNAYFERFLDDSSFEDIRMKEESFNEALGRIKDIGSFEDLKEFVLIDYVIAYSLMEKWYCERDQKSQPQILDPQQNQELMEVELCFPIIQQNIIEKFFKIMEEYISSDDIESIKALKNDIFGIFKDIKIFPEEITTFIEAYIKIIEFILGNLTAKAKKEINFSKIFSFFKDLNELLTIEKTEDENKIFIRNIFIKKITKLLKIILANQSPTDSIRMPNHIKFDSGPENNANLGNLLEQISQKLGLKEEDAIHLVVKRTTKKDPKKEKNGSDDDSLFYEGAETFIERKTTNFDESKLEEKILEGF